MLQEEVFLQDDAPYTQSPPPLTAQIKEGVAQER